jgi:cytochrome bd-type quinol oxidase subunit 2
MDAGDVVAITEVALIGVTWALTLRREQDFQGRRSKLAVSALALPTVAVVLDLALTAITHFHSPDSFVAQLWAYTVIFTLVVGVCGLALAIVGKGSPRIAAMVWSSWALIVAIYNITASEK